MPNSGLYKASALRRLPFIAGGADGEPDEPNPNESEPTAPQFVPAEEFRQFQTTMQGSMSALTEALTGMRQTMDTTLSRQREPVPTPDPAGQGARAPDVEAT